VYKLMFCTFIFAVLLLKYCFPTGDQLQRYCVSDFFLQRPSRLQLLPSYSQFLSQISMPWQRGSVGENAIGNIQWPIPENPTIDAKISQISFTQAES